MSMVLWREEANGIIFPTDSSNNVYQMHVHCKSPQWSCKFGKKHDLYTAEIRLVNKIQQAHVGK